MKHTRVKDLLNSTTTLQAINAKGWVRTFRNSQFIALNDGSTINNIQCVVDFENTPEETLKRITNGAAISVTGNLVESKGAGQKYEIQVTTLEVLIAALAIPVASLVSPIPLARKTALAKNDTQFKEK
jgi:asparaginyl-tRNA synthetase